MNQRGWYVVGVIAFCVVAFQLFFRYQYIHLSGAAVTRVDRLTGSSCYLPCTPQPPIPTASPFDWQTASDTYAQASDEQNQRAILLAKESGTAVNLMQNAGAGYSWTAQTTDDDAKRALDAIGRGDNPWLRPAKDVFWASPPPSNSTTFETKLVCYCDSKGNGWRWEVHMDTYAVYYVNDNADLMKKYGVTPNKQ